MSNKWIWFNIGQKGSHNVTWQTAVIRDDFDPATIRFLDFDEDEDGYTIEKWVKKNEMSYHIHKSVAMCFEDLTQVAEWIKLNYETGEDVYVGNRNWTFIYDVFDMDELNEYGLGTPLWN